MKALDLARLFGDISGVSIQAYSPEGHLIGPAAPPSPLCELLAAEPAGLKACARDCVRRAAEGALTGQPSSFRCRAGLSCRVVPAPLSGEVRCGLLIGKVLSGIYGRDQLSAAALKCGLDEEEFMEAALKTRQLAETTLDHLSGILRQTVEMGEALALAGEQKGALRSRMRRTALLIDRLLQAPTEEDPYRPYVEAIRGRFALDTCALLLPGLASSSWRLACAAGREEKRMPLLKPDELQRILGSRDGGWMTLDDPAELKLLGVDFNHDSVTLGLLSHAGQVVGCLVCLGNLPEVKPGSALDLAARILALQVHIHESHLLWDNRSRDLSTLNRKSGGMFNAVSLDDLLRLGLQSAMDVMGAGRGSVLILDPDGATVVASAFLGNHAELSARIRSVEPQSISGEVFSRRQPLLVGDINQEPRFQKKRRYPCGSTSFVSVPIRNNGSALGVLNLTDRAGDAAFTEWDLLLCDRWSQQLAAAILKVGLQSQVEELRDKVITDALTRAYSRSYADQSLEREMTRAIRFQHPLSLLKIDIDDFRDYNSALGHEAADLILKQLAGTLKENIRGIDILGRYGGEEFVLILPGTSLKGAINVAEKLRSRVEASGLGGKGTPPEKSMTISLGIATFPDMAMDKEELLSKADQALLRAKSMGKNVAISWM